MKRTEELNYFCCTPAWRLPQDFKPKSRRSARHSTSQKRWRCTVGLIMEWINLGRADNEKLESCTREITDTCTGTMYWACLTPDSTGYVVVTSAPEPSTKLNLSILFREPSLPEIAQDHGGW